MDDDTLELAETAILEGTDPVQMNALALGLGMDLCEAKREAADLESRRAVVRFEIQKQIRRLGDREGNPVTNEKVAETLAKDDPDYLDHCAKADAAALRRDRLEVLYDAAKQRAWLLPRPVEAAV